MTSEDDSSVSDEEESSKSSALSATSSSEDEDEDSNSTRNPQTSSQKRLSGGNKSTSTQPRNVSRKVTTNNKNVPKRLLRSRDKQPKLEEKKEEFKCSVCKKIFATETSLNRHSRWCKPKRNLRVKARVKAKAGLSTEAENTISSPRKRGRPKRSVVVETEKLRNTRMTKEARIANPKRQDKAKAKRRKISTYSNQTPDITEGTREISKEKASSSLTATTQDKKSRLFPRTEQGGSNKVKSMVLSSDQSNRTSDVNASRKATTSIVQSENERICCSKCKNVYRTVESLNKHLQNCYTLSSSSDCDDDEQEDEGISEVFSRESKVIPILVSSEEEVESESDDESEILDGKRVSPENISQPLDSTTPEVEGITNDVLVLTGIQEPSPIQQSESLSITNFLPATNSPVKIQEKKPLINNSSSSPIPVPARAFLQTVQTSGTNMSMSGRTECLAGNVEGNSSPLPLKAQDSHTPSTFVPSLSGHSIIEQTLSKETLVLEQSNIKGDCNEQLQNILTQFQNNKDYTIQIKGQVPIFPTSSNRQVTENSPTPTPSPLVGEDPNRSTHLQLANLSVDTPHHQPQIPNFYSNIPQANLNPHMQSQMHAHFLSQGIRIGGLPQMQNHQHHSQFINPSSEPRLLQVSSQHASHLYNPGLGQTPLHPQIGNVGWSSDFPNTLPPQHLNPMERFNPPFQHNSDIIAQMHASHTPVQQHLQTVVMQDCNGQIVNFQIPYPSSQQQNQYLQYASNYHHIQQQQNLQIQLQQQHQQQIAEAMFQQQQQQAMQQTAAHGYFPPASYPVSPRPGVSNPPSTFYRQIAPPQHINQHHESTQQVSQGLPNDNVTYMVVQQGETLAAVQAPSNTTPKEIPTPSAPGGNDKQQQPICSPQPSISLNTVGALSSPQQVQQQPQYIQCIKVNAERDGGTQCSANSSSNTGSTTTAKPCPCPDCHQQRVFPGVPIEKAANKIAPAIQKKLQRQLGFSPTTWGFNVPVSSPPKKTKPTQVRAKAQLTSIMAERQGQGLLHYKSMVFPSGLPKLLPATIVTTSPTSTSTISTTTASTSDSVCLPPTTTGKLPVSTPNIAVVRPMEQHPLQRLSDQIQQIESTFLTGTSTPPPTVGITANEISSQNSTNPNPTVSSSEATNNESRLIRSGTISVGPSGPSAFVSSSSRVETPDRILGTPETIQQNPTLNPVNALQADIAPEPTTPNTALAETSNSKTIPDPNKAIKITLKRKEGGDSYSIDNISDPGSQTAPGRTGTMRSLKIKAKITSGEQAGTSTDVVVLPVVHTVPIPDPDVVESNLTVVEEIPGSAFPPSGHSVVLTFPEKVAPKLPTRLTHRAVIVYEVRCNDVVLFRSSDVRAVWDHIFETVQGTTVNHNLPPLSYPATNISLPENKRDAAASFNQLGLTHRAVQFLLEQLPGANKTVKENTFRFHEPPTTSAEDSPVEENPSGSARTEPYSGRKPFDMFGWLASKHRKPMVPTQNKYGDLAKVADLPMAMKYRNLSKQGNKHLNVYWSKIHGRGLFTSRDIEENDMIIEYAGEVIRSTLCDLREKYYDSKGIGCYMFRIDEKYVVDATMKGNAARFINHSCEPNCRSKMMEILGKKHILIFATKRISCGEELTYDYKFPFEDVKIPCFCGSSKCRRFLN